MVVGLFPTQHRNILANTASVCSSTVTTCANSALASPGNGEALSFNDKIKVFHKWTKLYQLSFHPGGEQLWVSRSNACSPRPEHSCSELCSQRRSAENFSLQGLKQISREVCIWGVFKTHDPNLKVSTFQDVSISWTLTNSFTNLNSMTHCVSKPHFRGFSNITSYCKYKQLVKISEFIITFAWQ